ncbi:hypothetical protein NEDG_02208 [Nematocida displodere]|uniref:RING-type domain-containing protein n=1 Tax=Nematocida displodere TaxID=1805483 RepID=A0A177EEZ4_9MICR|nr:hypothetical protein NEDG_02208 [Nematocida displodere]
MKSTLVRSFGKVFETGLGMVLGKALRCHMLCLIVLCVIVGCADEVSEPEYITSPYTKPTMDFFEKSGFEEWPNRLATVQIDKKRCILKRQPKTIYIFLQNYTLETVPQYLAREIEFSTLTITPRRKDKVTRTNPAVLEKILSALGTVCADTLVFSNLDLDGSGSENKIQRMGHFGRKETPEVAPPITRCILGIKTLWIRSNTLPAISWLQKRLDLSLCQINLKISGKLELENLELLDGFNAGYIEVITLEDFKRLDSLDCKLFRESPLPEELTISTTSPIFPKISEEIARNIISKEWNLLVVPLQVWTDLMSPGSSPKLFIAANLTVYIPQHGMFGEFKNSSLSTLGDDTATVKSLTFKIYTRRWLMSSTLTMAGIINWISREFRGLEELNVWGAPGEDRFACIRENQVEITTNPTLKGIWVDGAECMYNPDTNPGATILCFSLEAWEAYMRGTLGDELAQSLTQGDLALSDLSRLSTKQQARVMNREKMDADVEACCVCLCIVSDLKATNSNADMCILDYPTTHIVCESCLGDILGDGKGDGKVIWRRLYRKKHMLPLVKNRIERNSQGMLVITMPIPPSVMSFPRATPDATLPAI